MMAVRPAVYIVDDDPGLRRSLGRMLSRAAMKATTYGRSREFLEAAPHIAPGCVLLDYWIAAPSGVDVLRAVAKIRSNLPVIVITGNGDIETAVAAMKAGAFDFIQKPMDCNRLLSMISQAFQTLDSDLKGGETEVAIHKVATLSKREFEVLQAFEAGLTTKQIAHSLGISVRTVEAHRANILERLGVKRLTSAVRLSVIARLGAKA
ncbi:MAG: response regulator [Hyphomicrobiales bacterium]|nr:response regulator [Hyphomicrobiales bacterium]